MRTSIILLGILLSFSACKDASNDKSGNIETSQEEYVQPKEDNSNSSQDRPVDQITDVPDSEDTISPGNNNSSSPQGISGIYLKNDHPEDGNCSCYCIDVKMNGTSELCLVENDLYINGRFTKSGKQINVYFSGKSPKTENTEIPWDTFEKNTPIAVLTPSGNGFELDWKGFTVDGEIAVDYAIYGKKTLEGTYNKK